MRAAVISKEVPTVDWDTFAVRVYTSESFQAARSKLPRAEIVSDLQTAEEDNVPAVKKRIRRINRRFLESDSESEGEKKAYKPPAKRARPHFAEAPQVTPPDMNRPVTSVLIPSVIHQQTVQEQPSPVCAEILRQQQNEMLGLLRSITIALGKNHPKQIEEFTAPLANESQFRQFDINLKADSDLQKRLIECFGFSGGMTVKETVWRIMQKQMTWQKK
ncbi:uncharacterized protein LOC134323165 isoform X2 [Trichomycterus rosablanca]|uniref:uncharacterized protein LOC134323165 isoform X2 n=1 Tax=Trichomycterus rosablanca TaxID=2290929 RepID=UPI002F354224